MAVLVHGLWMSSTEMMILEKRLQKQGFRTCLFSYHSMREDFSQCADSLFRFVQDLQEKRVHFVCHSLGGLLLHHLLTHYEIPWQGRAVLLGSPLAGSRVAKVLAGSLVGKILVGRNLAYLNRGCANWPAGYEVGVVGGTFNVGTGLFFGGWKHPGDGLVSLDEIKIPGVKEVFLARTNHLGLVFSRNCAMKTAHFLKNGRFFSFADQAII